MIGLSGMRNRSTGLRPARRNSATCSSLSSRQWPSYPARAALLAGDLAAFLELVLGAVAVVGVPGGSELLGDLGMALGPLGLQVRTVVTTDLGAFVPVDAEPAQ